MSLIELAFGGIQRFAFKTDILSVPLRGSRGAARDSTLCEPLQCRPLHRIETHFGPIEGRDAPSCQALY
jgi:hypothetical protein